MVRTAIVVGGGIGGAAAAASLAKSGVNVTLYERGKELREIGAGIFLKRNGLAVLGKIGCYDDVVGKGTWILRGELWESNGRAFVDRHLPEKAVIVVKRADLHSSLVKAAVDYGVTVKTDSIVRGATPNGELFLEDGRTDKADLIIGADGVGSAVRDSLGLNDYIKPTGNGSWRVLVPRADSDPTSKVVEFWRGHRRVLITQSGNDATYVCASCRDDDRGAASETFDRKVWGDHFPEFRGLIDRIDPALTSRRQHIKVRVNGWRKGVVAILGDAVHGQPPNLGQGAGCAIANAGALTDILVARGDVQVALREWETEQRKLTEQIQSFSNRYDDVVHAWPLALESLRTAFVSAIGTFTPTKMEWARLSQGVKQI
ncbi:NAD(P)/FAD-dependent oxidoreductase [Ferrovibrio sp.]|uniref:FAD-dependent oxidoreductase n=1 Tax=Ferrovibrio sp. TaxID=1917215 RepID=UPI000CBC07DE|nr:NAD(P)/FAD-dependent oxidoreductase [Ferrovibrio sp.]PJI44549.1 MAG: monooxygenase [Ferrovibrio sp.]